MRKRVGLNMLTSLIYQFVLLASGFIVPSTILRVYGSTINGLVSSITQFVGYFAIVEAGLGGAAIFALYPPLAVNDEGLVNRIVSTTKHLFISAGNMFLVLLVALAVIYPFFTTVKTLNSFEVFLLIIALGFKNIFDFYSLSKYQSLLTADNKLYIIQISLIAFQVINTSLIVGISLMKLNVLIVYMASSLPLIFRSLFLNIYVRKQYPFLDANLKPEKDLMKDRWNVLFLNIVQAVQGAGPVIIATVILGLKLVSVYTIYNVVFSGLVVMMTMITNSMQSYFGSKIASDDNHVNGMFVRFNLLFTQIVAIISSVTMVMIGKFIPLYIGSHHETMYYSSLLGILMAINMLFLAGKAPGGMLVMAAGHYRQTRVQSALQAAILIIVGSLLAKYFGLNGLIIGIVISNVYRWVDLIFYVPKRILDVGYSEFIKAGTAMILTFVVASFVAFRVVPSERQVGWLSWILNGGLSMLLAIFTSFIVLLLMNYKQSIRYVKKRMRERNEH